MPVCHHPNETAFDATLAAQLPASMQNTLDVEPVSTQKTLPLSETLGTTVAATNPSETKTRDAARMTILPEVSADDGEFRWVTTSRTRFQVNRQLGEGGAGEVLLAMDHDIGRQVALKKIRTEMQSPEALVRFIQEIRTVGRLEHPNIVPIHDVGRDEQGQYYFVMKYVRGETLEDIIARLRDGDTATHGLWPFERRVQVFRGLCEAVAFAHECGIVHRDIKPANVMVGPHGEVLLMDWGIARQTRPDLTCPDERIVGEDRDEIAGDARASWFRTRIGALIGTPAYMAPEQAQGKPAEFRSDVYSLSVLFYEWLVLKHYLEDKSTLSEVLEGVIRDDAPLASFVAQKHQSPVPPELGWFLKKGMQKDPGDRYQSVQQMLDRLELRSQGIFPIQCHLTFVKRLNMAFSRFSDRHPMIVTGAIFLGVPLAIGTTIWSIIS
ncbi:MAG: serine/threonine protein kinase [Deltaproteobacteria bacterium HGW-Deltaproteobacteria-22]|nr:MAG: serine/threonine protein kinase [Deltaproteobacteria bacterium HGW-Deltaproteobacteria-22]